MGTSRGADIATRSVHVKKAVDHAGISIKHNLILIFVPKMETDKEYRGAIHQLETLRLKRMTTLEYACQVSDIPYYGAIPITECRTHRIWRTSFPKVQKRQRGCSFVISVLWCQYTQAGHLVVRELNAHPCSKACSAHSKLAMDAQPVVEKVSPENDSSVFSTSLQRSPALLIPRPIFYYNYHVGECPDLVFGRNLVQYATSRGSEDDVPKIIRICVEEVNRRGLDAERIYMVSSSTGCIADKLGSVLLYRLLDGRRR